MTFGQRLKRLRYHLGLSQKEMAEKLGVHLMTISRYERDAMKPSLRFLEKIRETFKANPKWLLTGEGDMFLPKEKPVEALKVEHFGLIGTTPDFLAEQLAEKVLTEALVERGYTARDSIALYQNLLDLAKEKIKACYQELKAEIGFHLDTLERFIPQGDSPPPAQNDGAPGEE